MSSKNYHLDLESKNRGACRRFWTMVKDQMYVVIMFCIGIASTISISVTTQYMYRRVAAAHSSDMASLANVSTDSGPCGTSEVNVSSEALQVSADISADAARWTMYMMLAHGVPPLVTTVVWGAYSDQVGRRFLFILPLSASLISAVLTCFVIYFDLHLAFLLVGEFIVGCAGGGVTLGIATFAYSSDQHTNKEHGMTNDDMSSAKMSVTTTNSVENEDTEMDHPRDKDTRHETLPAEQAKENQTAEAIEVRAHDKNRGLRILIIECISLSGRAMAQMCNGYFISYSGFFYPMLTSTAIVLVTLIIAYFAVKPQEKKAAISGSTFVQNVLAPLKTVFRAIRQPRTLLAFVLCNLAMMLLLFGDAGYNRMVPIYQMSPPFCWSSVKLGWFQSEFTFTLLLSIPTLMIFKRLNMSEPTMCGLGTMTEVVSMLIYFIINSSEWVFYVVPVLMSSSLIPYALTRSILSRLAGPATHGSMFALGMLFEQTMYMIGGLTGSGMYQATVAKLHSAIFIYFFGVYFAGAIVFFIEGFFERRYPPLQPVETEVSAK